MFIKTKENFEPETVSCGIINWVVDVFSHTGENDFF